MAGTGVYLVDVVNLSHLEHLVFAENSACTNLLIKWKRLIECHDFLHFTDWKPYGNPKCLFVTIHVLIARGRKMGTGP